MRLLHTSDWHLGRSLHRADLRAAQQSFLDQLVEVVHSERVDAVLVSGDVYDRAVPPVDAVAMCEEALVRLRGAGARVVVISGNHDSATRLGFGGRLVDAAGVHLRTRVSAVAEPVLLEDEGGVLPVYAIPYLEPEAVRHALPLPADAALPSGGAPEDPPRGHEGVLSRVIACIAADRAERGAHRSVVLAHGWVTGGSSTESERDISIGGVGNVPASLFSSFDYAALGHLHGPQVLAEHLRYSGSPLPYSFSEAGHRKGSWLVELGAGGLTRVEQVPAPVHRPLAALRGRIDTLLTAPEHRAAEAAFVSVALTDPARPEAAAERLRQRFPHLLVLSWAPEGAVDDALSYRARVAGRDDLSVASGFVEHVRRSPATDHERLLLQEALEAAGRADTETAPWYEADACHDADADADAECGVGGWDDEAALPVAQVLPERRVA